MARARRAALAALVLVVFLVSLAVGVGLDARSAAARLAARSAFVPAARGGTVAASSSILVAEVVTGGGRRRTSTSSSRTPGRVPVDLAGLELVYVTPSGSTVTRKATWPTPLPLDPGRHLLVANAAGSSRGLPTRRTRGGLAATGGAARHPPDRRNGDRRSRLGRRRQRLRRRRSRPPPRRPGRASSGSRAAWPGTCGHERQRRRTGSSRPLRSRRASRRLRRPSRLAEPDVSPDADADRRSTPSPTQR